MAEDYVVILATNHNSAPYRYFGQRIEVQRWEDTVHIFHWDQEIATHAALPGQHQFRIPLEHGPGAIARITCQHRSTVSCSPTSPDALPEVELRDLAYYEALCGCATAQKVRS